MAPLFRHLVKRTRYQPPNAAATASAALTPASASVPAPSPPPRRGPSPRRETTRPHDGTVAIHFSPPRAQQPPIARQQPPTQPVAAELGFYPQDLANIVLASTNPSDAQFKVAIIDCLVVTPGTNGRSVDVLQFFPSPENGSIDGCALFNRESRSDFLKAGTGEYLKRQHKNVHVRRVDAWDPSLPRRGANAVMRKLEGVRYVTLKIRGTSLTVQAVYARAFLEDYPNLGIEARPSSSHRPVRPSSSHSTSSKRSTSSSSQER